MMDLGHQQVALMNALVNAASRSCSAPVAASSTRFSSRTSRGPLVSGSGFEARARCPAADPRREPAQRSCDAKFHADEDGDQAGGEKQAQFDQALSEGSPCRLLCMLDRNAGEQAQALVELDDRPGMHRAVTRIAEHRHRPRGEHRVQTMSAVAAMPARALNRAAERTIAIKQPDIVVAGSGD